MFQSIGNLFNRKDSEIKAAFVPIPKSSGSAASSARDPRKQTFSKVFRWKLPSGQSADGLAVEVVGSFTGWHPVALKLDRAMNTWHANFSEIQGNRTHHYMILINGKPTFDQSCDGLAVPCGPHEERFQAMTNKGPRVCMLFAQTK